MNDYLSEVYDWITKQDNSFSGDVDIESFKQKMQDDSYAKEIHGWMSSIDNSFSADVPESDFLAKVKKKDSSALQGAVSPEDTQDIASVSEGGQPSLVQLSQDSLEERFSGYKDLPIDEQISLIKQEEKRPFFEAHGLDMDQIEASKKREEEVENKLASGDFKPGRNVNPWAKTENIFLKSLEPTEKIDLESELRSIKTSRLEREEKVFTADSQYHNAKYEQIVENYPPEERGEQYEKENVDLGYIPTDYIDLDGGKLSVKGLEKKLYDQDFIDDLQDGKVNLTIDNANDIEVLDYLNELAQRQIESGGQFGDVMESLYTGTLDMFVAGPLEIAEGLAAVGMDALETIPRMAMQAVGIGDGPSLYHTSLYMNRGGLAASAFKKHIDKVREKKRLYYEDTITESLIKGHYGNAFAQTSNSLAESAPLIVGMIASSPALVRKFGEKAAQKITLGAVGLTTAGTQSLDLKQRRLKGELDISDGMLLLNAALTGGAEAFFERATLGIINAGRGVLKLGKVTAPELAERFVKGFGKSLWQEGTSEGLTELSNSLTNIFTGTEEYTGIEDIAVRLSDAALIGAIMGGGMHSIPYAAKSISEAKFKMLDSHISVLFTLEDGSTKEMSRADALRFVKDPEIAAKIRSHSISMDASLSPLGKSVLEDIVYGFHAPDAVAAREIMFDKEKVVQDLADKLESSKEITPEDVNALADAMAEMEAEGKVNEYNVTDRTVATRKRVAKFLKDNGIEIVDAVQQQDTSMSEVTETTDANKIDSKEQYRSIKKQVKDGKKKPTFVKSQNQPGVRMGGKSVQTSEVTQGRFKSVSEAKNAMKEFELKQKAAKDGKVVSNEAFPINNKEFINTKKETLDEIPKEVLDKNEYHIISPSKKGLNAQEKASRMGKLKAALDDAGAKYYTVKGVYNGVVEESLVVTGINNAQALSLGRNLGQESVFSSKDGLMFGNGSVAPLTGDVVKGPEARRRGSLTIMNVGGRKVSMHTEVDRANMSYGKNFNSDNIHRLDESDPNYDSELFDGVPEDRKRALGFAFKLLSSIGGLNVNIVRNSEAMAGQMKQLGQDSDSVAKNKRASFFRAADKTIYVNLETVRGNTLFHEIIHPMVDFIKKTDPALYSKIEGEVYESNVKRRVTKDGRRLKGSYMEWVQAQPTYANLSKEAQIEEAFAEMMGDAAYGHFVNRQSTLGRLRELMKEILKKITPLKFDNPESVSLDDLSLTDIRKNLAGALVNGRSITVGGVEFEVGDIKGTTEDRFQVDAIDEKTQVQYKYDQNSEVFAQMEDEGIISSGKTMQDFKGKTMMVHSPDAMFSGTIIDRDGTILVEGKGGVLYTLKFNEEGYFWASTDNAANKMVDQLNSMLEANGGKIYMALTTAPQDKLLSNTAANRGLVNLLTSQNFISKIGLNKAGVYKALIDAANFKKEVIEENKKGEKIKKTIGLGLGLGAFRASSKFHNDVLQKVWDKLGNENSSFKDRKLFSDQLLKSIKAQKFGAFQAADSKANFVNFIKTTAGDKSMVDFSKSGAGNIQSIKKALINVLTEPSLREEDATNKVYAVLEIDGPVKAVKTDSYESYGTSIVSAEGSRAKIHRIDNRENWYDFAKDPKTGEVVGNKIIGRTKGGKPIYRRSQIMPSTAGVSMQPLRFQAPTEDGVYLDRPYDEFGETDYEVGEKVFDIAKKRGLGITRDRELAVVAKNSKGSVIGGAYTSYNNVSGEYTFDVVVDEEFEGKGVGSRLLDNVIDIPFEIEEFNPNSTVKVDVVNPQMKSMLESRGFEVIEKTGPNRFTMSPKSGLRFQAPTYDMEYTPNALISLSALSDNNRQPEQWVKEIGKGVKGASRDVDSMGLLDLLKEYKKGAKVKSIPKEVVERLIATNMAEIETTVLSISGSEAINPALEQQEGDDAEMAAEIMADFTVGEGSETMYAGFRLPGGDNYREFLIRDKSSEDIFTAPHYGDLGQNLIASVRADDRVGANGEKILFVQEIQSDWVQGVNKEGFATKENISEISKQLEDLKSLEVRISSDVVDGKKTKEESKELLKGISDTRVDLQRILNGLRPHLPWAKTDLWVGLTIRKLVNQASKEGYDQIAFVNGEQSDVVQGHSDGRTAEFYNKIVPKNINNELKRLVKGMKYEAKDVINYNMTFNSDEFIESRRYSESYPGSDIHVFNKGDMNPYSPKLTVFEDTEGDGNTYIITEFKDPNTGEVFEKAYNKFDEYKNSYDSVEQIKDMEMFYFLNKTSAFLFKSIKEKFPDPTGPKELNAVINLTPELKAATDKVGPLRFQAPTLFNEPNPEAGDVARAYMIDNSEEFGIDPNAEVAAVRQLDDENSKMIADAYEAIVDNPKDPEVKESYEALADETLRQYESILDRGYEVEIWRGEGEPYANSAEMIQDARDNKHMYIFGTEAGFGEGAITPEQREDNSMLAETEYADLNGEPLLVNDVFRFVHDFFGHTELGNGFGPIGEENAWLIHSRMYSPTARKAMTTETRGQNSWVNYNKNLRREDGSVPKRGDEDYVPLSERPFADQKMGILPNEIIHPTDLKYQVPTDGETNVYTSGLATIAWDISKAIIDSDYKAGRYLTKYIDKKQQYDIRLTTLLAKPFGTHSNKEVKEIMVRSKGNLNAELLRVSEASNKLKKAMKGSNLSRSEVNDLLHNLNEVKAMEASALKEALIEMRTHIDYLSKTLVSEGLVKGQTQFTIDSNLGVYVTRSYKQFDVKGWTQTDNDIIKNAKDFLYREAKKDNPEATEERLQEIVGVAYRKLTEDKEFFRSSNGATNLDGLTRVNSIFKEKKIIPEEIRDLWGEIDNPLYNYSNTISKVARTISAERMYKDLNEIGQGKFISDIQTPEAYNELVGSKWGSLEGKFVDEEMFAVMNQTVKNLEGNLWYDSYMRLVLFNKKMKTVWNPGTHAKNVIGNTSFAIMNGHIGFNGGMYKDAKTAIKAVQSLKSPELKALYSKLVALGVVNSSASLQEIRGIAEDINDTKFDLSEYLDEKSGKIQKLMAKAARATGKPIKYLDKKAMQAYQAEDDVWKIFGYLSEKARYVKAGMDAKAAEELAAKNIRNLYPNYNEIPRIIRYLGRSPIVGSFVAFQAESIRNAKNTVLLGFEELGSSNPGMRKIGAQRIGGTLATMTLLEGLQLYTAQFLGEALGFGGEDDEEVEDRKMRLLLPEWDAAGNIAYMFKGKLDSRQAKDKQTEGDRYFDYINFSSISGVGYAKDIIRLSFYDLDTQIGKESAMNTLKKIYAPFLGQEMTLKVMIDALGNKGGKVYNPSENGIKQAIDIVTFVGEQVKPGAVKSGLRLKESMYDLDSELVPGYEALALFGLRISRVNVNKGLGIKSNFIYKDMINTVDKGILRDRAALLKEAEENPKFNEYLDQMADLIGAARLNSVSGEDIKAILYNSRVSKPIIEEAHLRYLDKYLEDVIRVDSK